METLGPFIEAFAPWLMLAAMLVAIIIAINGLGRRFERHDDLIRALDARVGNLDKSRKATWAQKLARPFAEDTEPVLAPPLVPPPLPPRNPTLNAVDWEEELVDTEDLTTRQTGRYPQGTPPKGPSDDDP